MYSGDDKKYGLLGENAQQYRNRYNPPKSVLLVSIHKYIGLHLFFIRNNTKTRI